MTKTPMSVIYKGVLPFLIGIVVFAVFLFLFPELALFLPNHLMK